MLANPAQFAGGLFPQSQLNQGVQQSFLSQFVTPEFAPGTGVIEAARPIFERNLQQGTDVLRQSGPRFSSGTERLVQQQGTQAIQDFNLFQQQVLESGADRQLQGLIGAGQFAQGNQAAQIQALLPLLQAAFQGGGVSSAPVITENPGSLSSILGIIGTAGSLAAALPTGGASLAALPATTGAIQGGQTRQLPGG